MASPAALLRRVAVAALAGALALSAPVIAAEEVKTHHHGLTLNGNLELATGRNIEDGVILITHGLLAHNGMELIAALQKLLQARGLSTLAINLSLGNNDRKGFFDCGRLHVHRPADALDEINTWIGWLKAKGASEIILMGHSQGGNQTAVFAAQRDDPSVRGVVLLAPATFSQQRAHAAYRQRYNAELADLLAQAQSLVRDGRGATHMSRIGFLSCENATVTAASFVAWYAPSEWRHTPSVLPRLKKGTLVVAAGADSVVPDLADEVRPLDGAGGLTVKVIDGADHFFLDLYAEEVADMVAAWLGR